MRKNKNFSKKVKKKLQHLSICLESHNQAVCRHLIAKITGKKTPSKPVVSTVERDYEKSVYEKEEEKEWKAKNKENSKIFQNGSTKPFVGVLELKIKKQTYFKYSHINDQRGFFNFCLYEEKFSSKIS